jgi:hypothetical protein
MEDNCKMYFRYIFKFKKNADKREAKTYLDDFRDFC